MAASSSPLPYEGEFTLIGTTESEYTGDLAHPAIAAAEQAYLVDMANRYFQRDLSRARRGLDVRGPAPVAGSLAGRPQERHPRLRARLRSLRTAAAVDLRRQAHDVPQAGGNRRRTRSRPCWATPGVHGRRRFHSRVATCRMATSSVSSRRCVFAIPGWNPRCCSGTRGRTARACSECWRVAWKRPIFGAEVLPGLYEREIAYLRSVEFAVTAEDILFRRSKLGLHLAAGSVTALDDWLSLSSRNTA